MGQTRFTQCQEKPRIFALTAVYEYHLGLSYDVLPNSRKGWNHIQNQQLLFENREHFTESDKCLPVLPPPPPKTFRNEGEEM